MTTLDQCRSAITNVGRRKLRSFLASLGVVVGVVTIVLMVSLATGVRQQINRQFASVGLDRLTVNSGGGGGGGGGRGRGNFPAFGFPGQRKAITPADVARWQSLPGVVQVLPEVNLPSGVELELGLNGTNQTVRMNATGFRPDAFFQTAPEALAGTLDLPETGAMILSQGAAAAAGVSSNDLNRLIGQTAQVILRAPRGETQSCALRIAGVSQDRGANIRVSINDRIAMKNWWHNSTNILDREGYDSATIRVEDVQRADKLSVQLRGEGFMVQSIEAIMTMANRVVTSITLMFTLIASIGLLVAAIGITNTMVMAIYERTREIGILKAMGASRSDISRLFMLEAGCIGMIGGAAGLALGWFLGLGLNQLIPVIARWRDLPAHGPFFVVTPFLAAGVVFFAALIGVVAGFLPAQRAARLDPLEALRHE